MKHAVISVEGGSTKKEELYDLLSRDDSGFEIDFSKTPPLNSGLEAGIAVAGIVLNAAQLAATLYQIRKANQQSRIQVERRDGPPVVISADSPKEIEAQLAHS